MLQSLAEVGKAPEVIVEVTSRSTRLRDVGLKKGLYEAMGVKEYILFDPRGEYLMPRFSPRPRLTFRVVEGALRISETPSGQLLPTPAELNARLLEESRKVELERERGELARQQAEFERQRATRLAERLR